MHLSCSPVDESAVKFDAINPELREKENLHAREHDIISPIIYLVCQLSVDYRYASYERVNALAATIELIGLALRLLNGGVMLTTA